MVSWVKRKVAISDAEFLQFEEKIGVKLPNDFSKWFSVYGNPEETKYGELNGEEYELDDFYSLEEIENESDGIFEEIGESKKGTIIPFAFDSALNQYCFYYENGQLRGIFLLESDDDPTENFDGDEIKKEVLMCSTFSEFLEVFSR